MRRPEAPSRLTWKARLAFWATEVPKNLKELAWKVFIGAAATTTSLVALFVWQNPGAVVGTPVPEQSISERWARAPEVRPMISELLTQFYESHETEALGLFSWTQLHRVEGLWVRPGNRYPNLVGPHPLPPLIREVAGELIFGECAVTDSRRYSGFTSITCPISTSHDVWGYIVAIVPEGREACCEKLLLDMKVLAHRVTQLLY